jgi:hypothetical protein
MTQKESKDMSMTQPRHRVVLVGTPSDAAAVADWAAMRSWATHHGWETSRTVSTGRTWLAIATEDVLDGTCSPAEATIMQALRADGVPCISVHNARAMFAPAAAPVPASA